jgi:hypothetical protein
MRERNGIYPSQNELKSVYQRANERLGWYIQSIKVVVYIIQPRPGLWW